MLMRRSVSWSVGRARQSAMDIVVSNFRALGTTDWGHDVAALRGAPARPAVLCLGPSAADPSSHARAVGGACMVLWWGRLICTRKFGLDSGCAC